MNKAEKWQLPISYVAESLVSVTDVKHVYCPRPVYFDGVLHAQLVFGSQQEESQELRMEYVRKELSEKMQSIIRLNLLALRSLFLFLLFQKAFSFRAWWTL
ncbi:hypothetical protein KEJ19_00525 [Candidatus Bathyarchaeota archaeon]|nr:hypothetical protein [Candidatus Bathyarchaeota archaeon]